MIELLTLQTLGISQPENDAQFEWLFGQNTLDSAFDEAIKEINTVST